MATPVRFVRNSETGIFRDCLLKWYLTYYLGFLSNRVNPNFWLGTLVHLSLSEYHLGRVPDPAFFFYEIGRELIEQERAEAIATSGKDLDFNNVEELENYLAMGMAMLEGYTDWDSKHRDFTVIDSELSYYVELETPNKKPFTFVCRFDLLAENSEGLRVHDFKTAADFRDAKRIDQDQQFRRYPWVVRMAHPKWAEEVAGSAWMGLRKIVPSNRSKPPYFQRVLVDLEANEYEQVGRELGAEVDRMLHIEDLLNKGADHRNLIYPSPSFDCTFKCDYFRNGLCQAWRAGLDPKKYGENYGSWGNDMYSEYREDDKGAVPIGRREGGD